MDAWQNRVIGEKEQLGKKLNKLCRFLRGNEFKALDMEDRWALEEQFKHMENYNIILLKRIARF